MLVLLKTLPSTDLFVECRIIRGNLIVITHSVVAAALRVQHCLVRLLVPSVPGRVLPVVVRLHSAAAQRALQQVELLLETRVVLVVLLDRLTYSLLDEPVDVAAVEKGEARRRDRPDEDQQQDRRKLKVKADVDMVSIKSNLFIMNTPHHLI